MRMLTEAEAKVLALLLANTARDERERLRQSGLPRSTYHAARRRAYAEGWLEDRYLPSPSLFGYPECTVLVARPFADGAQKLAERWSADPGCVVNWGSSQLAFGTFFHRTPAARQAALRNLQDPDLASSVQAWNPRLEQEGLPVFFDFEGVWGHVSAATGTRAYPRGFPPTPPELREPDEDPWNPRSRWAAHELLDRPFVAEREGRAGHLVGPLGLPFAMRKLLAGGWVLHRVFALPSAIPPFRGRGLERVVLIRGTLRNGVTPGNLFVTLTRSCRVFPFLYLAEGGRLLLGALGGANGAGASPTEPERRPVMATLREALEGIEILEETTSNLALHVNHRYDRLRPPESARGTAR